MAQRSRRAGTALIKRHANPSGSPFWKMEMTRQIGKELIDRMRKMNDSLESITPSEPDSPQPVAWLAFATDGSESSAVYLMQEQAQAAADEWGWSIAPLYATPQPPSTPGEGTRQAGCTLTDEEREAILYCVSCAQDYRDRLDGSDDRATQMIEIAMRLAVGPAPVEGPRTASVTDVGGAGPTITHAEREALEIAVEYVGSAYAVHHHAATLRGLLERTT